MSRVPFNRRFELHQDPPIETDFPESARIALVYLFEDLISREFIGDGYSSAWDVILNELHRTARVEREDGGDTGEPYRNIFLQVLLSMTWERVYVFCERVYDHLLTPAGHFVEDGPGDAWVETDPLAEVQQYYTDELNSILEEDNIGFRFVDGQFQRRGYAQTQRSLEQMGRVLVQPRLGRVRDHYNKARRFFDRYPEPDPENCVKEAVCALEACVETLTDKPAAKDFAKVLRQIQNESPDSIPGTIVEAMVKLHAYRGSGQGVAHSATDGSRVTRLEAELVLNLVASYVTYLVACFPQTNADIPF